MEFSNEYKYQLIALIVIVLLICICCMSNRNHTTINDIYIEKDIIYDTEEQNRENFTPKENPGKQTIDSFALRYAENIASDTFVKVIDPCSRISNRSDVIVCISNYNGYFIDILKDRIIDMYINLKRFNGEYVEPMTDLTTHEQQHFGRLIGDAYGSALSLSLDEITKNYDDKTKYDRNVFVPIFTKYLKTTFIDALDKAFGAPSSLLVSRPTPQVPKFNQKQLPAPNNPAISNKFHLSCDDILNNKIQVYIDGMRVLCKGYTE